MEEKTKRKYNHAFTIAFTVKSDNTGENVTGVEIVCGLLERIKSLIKEDPSMEIFEEATGLPFDTYEEY